MKHCARLFLAVSVALLALYFGLPSLTSAVICQDQKLPEPESIGAFYYLDSNNNSLAALEKQIAVSKKRGLIKDEIVVQIKGEKASLRLKSGQKMEFVVSLPNGVDPNKYQLISFEVKKGKREAVLAESTWTGSKGNPVFLSYIVSRFGNAYKITPSQTLPAGEYAFSPNDSYDTFCFGVDATEQNTGKK